MKFSWFYLLLFLYSVVGFCNRMVVRNISVEDGMSQSQVNCMYQDRSGFIWIGSHDGLNRYDGYQFDVFFTDSKDPNTIPGNDIQGIVEDNEGTLWIGTYSGGIARRKKGSLFFERLPPFEIVEEDGNEYIASIYTIVYDENGEIWVGTAGGLFVVDQHTLKVTHFQKKTGEIPNNSVRSLFRDRDGNIWIGTENGCVRYLSEEKKFEPISFTLLDPEIGLNNAVKAIQEDPDGRIWLGTRDGVFVYQPSKERQGGIAGKTIAHLRVLPVANETLDSENLWDLAFDGQKYIWGATHEQGLMRWDYKTFDSVRFSVDSSFSRGLSTNTTRALMFDATGLLWVGTRGRGVDVWNADSLAFHSWQNQPDNPNSLTDNEVWYFAQTDPESVWVSTFTGLNHIDFRTGDVRTYRQGPDKDTGLTTDYINTISAELETGNILVYSFDALDCLDPKTGKVEHFNWEKLVEQLNATTGLGLGTITSISKDILLVSIEDQVVRWNYRTGEFKKLQLKPEFSFEDGLKWISGMVPSGDGHFWVGSNFGLFRVDQDLNSFQSFLVPDKGGSSTHDKEIGCMMVDAEKQLWVGTNGSGVYHYALDGNELEQIDHFTVEDGLPADTIFGILEDFKGHIWISSMAGLSRIEINKGWIKNFDYLDGLPGNEFNGGAFLRGEDGRLMFGGVTGVVSFFPEELSRRTHKTPVVFTGLESTEYQFTQLKSGDEVKLSYLDKLFKINFAVLDYTMPKKNTFRARLEGYHDEWVSLGNENSQTFTNLDAGNYTYLLQGINSDGVWSGEPLKLNIKIAPAPWRSHWAYLLYFIVIGSVVGLIWKLQNQKIRERRANTKALREREQRLSLALWGSGDTMWDWEAETNSFMYTEITGTKTTVSTQAFQSYLESMHGEDVKTVLRRWEKHLKGKRETFSAEFRKKNSQDEWVWISQRGMVVRKDDQGNFDRIAGTMKDITAAKQSENNLKLLASAFESTLEAMIITDQNWKVMRVNHAFSQITGYSPDNIIGKSFHLLDSEDHESGFFDEIDIEIEEKGSWQGEIWMKNMFGRVFPTWRTTNIIRSTRGELQYMATVFLDISQHKKQENELRVLANYDHLTGLPNRSLFHDRLHQAMANCKRNKLGLALFFLDLDHFKWINDSYGHKYGDLVLIEVAKRLKMLVREQDTVARLGGDEFIVILEDIKTSRNAGVLAASIVEELSKPMKMDDNEFTISTSIGIAMYPEDGDNGQTLITNSDAAMYFAKNVGRNNYQFYAQTMNKMVHAKLHLETRMRKAIKNDELILFYQPRVCLKTLRPVGAEVLIRWNEPGKGLISPLDFIPVAEDTGMILPIGEWVIKRTFEKVVEFQKMGLPELSYSINLSSRQFKDNNLIKMIRKYMKLYGVKPHWIEMEITEGTIMERTEHTLQVLQAIKDQGIDISVDDFGTGYSSLSYLQRFPLSSLKVDKSFISNAMVGSEKDSAIVRAIINLGHNLGLKLVVEGIETQLQLDFLRTLNCEEGQGFLFSKPIPEKDYLNYLKQFK